MRFRHILILIVSIPALISCQRQVEDTASLKIKLPSAESFNKGVGAFSQINSSLVCYVVNVTGSGISDSQSSCDIRRGVFAGSAAPGSELSVTVPTGSNRKVEIYGILRNSSGDPCPNVQTGWPVPLDKVYLLGQVTGIDVRPPTTTVDITVTLPDESQNILTQLSMPSTCSAVTASAKAGRIFATANSDTSLIDGYKKISRISFKTENESRSSTGGYKMKNSAIVTGM